MKATTENIKTISKLLEDRHVDNVGSNGEIDSEMALSGILRNLADELDELEDSK